MRGAIFYEQAPAAPELHSIKYGKQAGTNDLHILLISSYSLQSLVPDLPTGILLRS